MQFLGNVLQQVPLFGTWFNALSGLSREAVIGIGSAAETLFRVMLKCVTGNLLDAFFMAIVAELLRGAFHPRSMRGSVLLVIVASALGALLLYMLHQIPSEKMASAGAQYPDPAPWGRGDARGKQGRHRRCNALCFQYYPGDFCSRGRSRTALHDVFFPSAVATGSLLVISTWLLYVLLLGLFAWITMLAGALADSNG